MEGSCSIGVSASSATFSGSWFSASSAPPKDHPRSPCALGNVTGFTCLTDTQMPTNSACISFSEVVSVSNAHIPLRRPCDPILKRRHIPHVFVFFSVKSDLRKFTAADCAAFVVGAASVICSMSLPKRSATRLVSVLNSISPKS